MVPLWFKRVFPFGFKSEAIAIVKLAGPLILTQMTLFFLGPVALIFCGHMGTHELDAVSLANSMINVFGNTIAIGMSSACDTLFSQLYGSKHKDKLGIVLQRSIFIISIAVMPCLAIHLNAEQFLIVIGQNPIVARLTGQYLLYFIPGLVSFFVFISLMKYIQNQNIIIPGLIIGFICNALNALLHYLLIYVANMGIEGSAIAQASAYTGMLILTTVYILVSGMYKPTWSGWSWESLEEWGTFCKLSIFGLLMICIEWWAFEAGMYLSGILGEVQLGANSVVFQLELIAYMLPLGLGIAGSIRVGQYLGAGSAPGAMTACRVAVTIVVIASLVTGSLMAGLRHYLPRIFTQDPEVLHLAANLLPILGLYMVFDGICGVAGGILRGAGRQKVGALIVFIGYFLGLSGGIPVMFLTDLQVLGLWIFLAIALFIEAIIYCFLLARLNWDLEVKKALERTSQNEDDDDDIFNSDDVTFRISSISNSDNEFIIPVTPSSSRPSKWALLWKRGLIVCACLLVFLTGLFCRIFIPLPEIVESPVYNMTTESTEYNMTTESTEYNMTTVAMTIT